MIVSGMAIPIRNNMNGRAEHIAIKQSTIAIVPIVLLNGSFFIVMPIIRRPVVNNIKKVADTTKCNKPTGIGNKPMPKRAKELNIIT